LIHNTKFNSISNFTSISLRFQISISASKPGEEALPMKETFYGWKDPFGVDIKDKKAKADAQWVLDCEVRSRNGNKLLEK
jgi:hypothetical protein